MSYESIGSSEKLTLLPVDDLERLTLLRVAAQRRLGRASVAITEATQEYHEAIQAVIAINEQIRVFEVNRAELITTLQQPNGFYDELHGAPLPEAERAS